MGRRLRAARKAKGLSQVQVAKILSLSGNSVISQWESGQNELNVHDMTRLCQLYGLTYEYLLEGVPDRMAHGVLLKVEAELESSQ